MKKKNNNFKINNYLNEIFLIIIGILLIVFPKFILHGIIISIGLYTIIKHGIFLYKNYNKISKYEIILQSVIILSGLLLVLFSDFIINLVSVFLALYLISQIITEIYHILVLKNSNKSYIGNIILLSLYTISIVLLLIFYKEISTFAVVLLGIILIFSQIIKIISHLDNSKNKTYKEKEYIDAETIE